MPPRPTMARLSFRDRFWSPPVAQAVTAPTSILLGAGAAAVAIVATAPLSLPLGILSGAIAGGAAYGGRVLWSVPRNPERHDPDPFAVQEPWRHFVSDALDARRRFDGAVESMDKGPLRDHLAQIAGRLDDGMGEVWRIAQQGNALVGARRRVDLDGARRELATVDDQADEPGAAGSRLAQAAEALRAQIASAERMEVVIADAVDRLRLLDARLDETVTRAIELSTTGASAQGAGRVGGDVEGLVTEMEALRLALDEVGGGGQVASSDPGTSSGSGQPASSDPGTSSGSGQPAT